MPHGNGMIISEQGISADGKVAKQGFLAKELRPDPLPFLSVARHGTCGLFCRAGLAYSVS